MQSVALSGTYFCDACQCLKLASNVSSLLPTPRFVLSMLVVVLSAIKSVVHSGIDWLSERWI